MANNAPITGQLLCPRRSGHIALCVGETLYVWGGFRTPAKGEASAPPLPPSDLWRYNADGDFWTCAKCTDSNCPDSTVGACGVKVGNYLYVLGGWRNPDGYLRQLYRLHLVSYQWEAVDTQPDTDGLSARWNFTAWAYGDRSIGLDSVLQEGWNNQLLKLDTTTPGHSWSNPRCQGEPPSPRSGHAGALLKDKVYIFGGQQRENVMNDLYCLDLSNPRPVWELLSPSGSVPQARYWHSLTAAGEDRLLLFGGLARDDSPLDDVWLLRLSPQVQWTELKSQSGHPRHYHTACCTQSGNVLVFGGCVDNILGYDGNMPRFSEQILEFQMQPKPLEFHESRCKAVVDLREILKNMGIRCPRDIVDAPQGSFPSRPRKFGDVHSRLPSKWPDVKAHNPLDRPGIEVVTVAEDDHDMTSYFDAVCFGQDLSTYRLQQKQRGIFLLINNEEFEFLSTRTGTDKDEYQLTRVFKQLDEKNVGISAQTAGGAGKTSAQKAGNAEKTRAQEAGDAGKTSAQEAGDAGKTSAQEAGDAGEMSAQEVDDAGETSAQEAGDAGETSAQEAGDAGETSAQKAGDAGDMSAQEVGDSGELPVLVEFKTTEKIHITSTRGNEQFDSEIVPSGADILIAEATLPALAYVFANYAHMLDITELLLA
ncbi:hypothetical protein BaRGS_00017732, partial [Batillaria attramentaria]